MKSSNGLPPYITLLAALAMGALCLPLEDDLKIIGLYAGSIVRFLVLNPGRPVRIIKPIAIDGEKLSPSLPGTRISHKSTVFTLCRGREVSGISASHLWKWHWQKTSSMMCVLYLIPLFLWLIR